VTWSHLLTKKKICSPTVSKAGGLFVYFMVGTKFEVTFPEPNRHIVLNKSL